MTRRQLDALLLASRDYWQPQPFREARPGWCEAHPAVLARLLALADDDCERLNDDAALAADFLAAELPWLRDLQALAELPLYPARPLAVEGERWAWEIPGRKRQQIEAFAAAMRPAGARLLDWCGGKGHLGRLLALTDGAAVTTLEIDAALCHAGAALAQRLHVPQDFRVADALTAGFSPLPGQHAVALHACGELHRNLLRRGVAAGIERFDVAPCCYHIGAGEIYQPLAAGAALALRRDDVRLAVTESVTAPPRERRQRDRRSAWKLAFTTWRSQCSAAAYCTFKPVPEAWLRGDFASFLAALCAREGLPLPSSRQIGELEEQGWRRQREVARLSIVRHACRRALEVWLALDLVGFLESAGYTVALGRFCARQLTPRNLLISAQRAG